MKSEQEIRAMLAAVRDMGDTLEHDGKEVTGEIFGFWGALKWVLDEEGSGSHEALEGVKRYFSARN